MIHTMKIVNLNRNVSIGLMNKIPHFDLDVSRKLYRRICEIVVPVHLGVMNDLIEGCEK